MNYYNQTSYVSNSELGNLHSAIFGGGVDIDPVALQNIFDFGNLVDSAITEPGLLNHEWKSVVNEATGEMMTFSDEDWRKAMRMADSATADPVVKMLLEKAKFQHAYYRRNFPYSWDRFESKLNTRCKLDILNLYLGAAADIKTTAAQNAEQLKHSIIKFRYYRQAALYMDLAKVDRFWFIGVSKKANKQRKHPVLKYAIKRGDDLYKLGYNEYNRLGIMYDLLVKGFDCTNNSIKLL